MNDQRLRPWTTIASEYVIDTPYLRLRSDTVELPNGDRVESYFVRDTPGFCIIFAVTPDRHVVMVRQYKHGIGRITNELPAGGIDRDEEPAACAIRELAEETGYAGDPPRLVRTFAADPTSSNGLAYLFQIDNAEPRFAQSLDPTEAINVFTVTLEEACSMARDGRIDATSQVAAVLSVCP